jgi:hypothetical protein
MWRRNCAPKGACAAPRALLGEDSLAAKAKVYGLSERGAPPLFDRLASVGGIREMTGRESFRLCGL